MNTDLTPPTPPTQETSAKTDYIWEVLNNYEFLYCEAVQIATRAKDRKYSPQRTANAFRVAFSQLTLESGYRYHTRGTPGKLDWVWIASSFIEGLTTPTPTVDPSTEPTKD